MLVKYGIRLAYISKYHSQANPIERFPRVIKIIPIRLYWRQSSKMGYIFKRSSRCYSNFLEWGYSVDPKFEMFGREINLDGIKRNHPTMLTSTSYNPLIRSVELRKVFADISERLKKSYQKSSVRYILRRREERLHRN